MPSEQCIYLVSSGTSAAVLRCNTSVHPGYKAVSSSSSTLPFNSLIKINNTTRSQFNRHDIEIPPAVSILLPSLPFPARQGQPCMPANRNSLPQ